MGRSPEFCGLLIREPTPPERRVRRSVEATSAALAALLGRDAKTAAVAARVVSTDTLAHPSNAITVTSLIANALAVCG